MNRKGIVLSLFLVCLSSVWGQKQQSMRVSLWEGFHKALQEDLAKNKQDKEEKLFQEGIEALKTCLSTPHSRQNVQEAKEIIQSLRNGMPLTREKQDQLAGYSHLITEYGKYAERFYKIFNGKITHPDYDRYRNSIETLTPPKLQTLGNILKTYYESNGLESLSFPEEYTYLNQKLAELREGFKELEVINDREQLYQKLESLIQIESEISEDHKTYRTLK